MVVIAIDVPLLSAGAAVGDTAEAQTVPYILGIAHPTGFPAYTLAGWLFSHALPFGTVAWRMNAFSTVCMALSAAGVALLVAAVDGPLITAFLTAIVFALGGTVWYDALRANAHVLSATCSTYALLGSVLFARFGDRRVLIAASVCCGIGIAAHPFAIWVVPGLAVALAWQSQGRRWSTIALAAAACALPLLLYAYLPLRSAVVAAQHLDPTAGAPLFGAGSIDWDTNHPGTPAGFLDEVLGRRVGASLALLRALDPRAIPQAATFWLGLAAHQYRSALLVIAAIGAGVLALTERRSLSVLAAGTLGGVLFAHAYQGDAYIDRYAIVSFAVTAVLAAVSARLRLRAVPVPLIVASALAVSAGMAYAQNRTRTFDGPLERGEAIIAAARRDIPDGAIVVAQWNDATALGYGAFVEHALGSRTIVAAWPTEYVNRYPEWARDRTLVLFLSPLATGRLPYLPAPWLHAIPSSNGYYHIYQVVPPPPLR